MSDTRAIRLSVNGEAIERSVEPRISLADFLRDELRLTGTHLGCEHGVCGACTVLVDNRSVRACLMLAVQADGTRVRTVESLGTPDRLNPLQRAFMTHHALQCGFCTPGILMTVTEFMERRPPAQAPSEAEVRQMLSGNICRCTGYQNIVDAVIAVMMRDKEQA
jgi:aerobic-type carbon monoxide dehydrogenase small subunit (CoxS/CutS family)